MTETPEFYNRLSFKLANTIELIRSIRTFFIIVGGEEWTDYEQAGNDLFISFPAGTESIEIIGSYAVPEFGTIAMIVLAVAIVSIIAITAKTRTTLIPKL